LLAVRSPGFAPGTDLQVIGRSKKDAIPGLPGRSSRILQTSAASADELRAVDELADIPPKEYQDTLTLCLFYLPTQYSSSQGRYGTSTVCLLLVGEQELLHFVPTVVDTNEGEEGRGPVLYGTVVWKGRPSQPVSRSETARDGANRESEPRNVLGQKLGSASVKCGGGGGNTDPPTHLVDGEAPRELADHEEEEDQIEEEEGENQDEIESQSRQAKRRRRVNKIRRTSKNGLRNPPKTYMKMKVMINQAAKKIPIALLSCSG